MRFLILICCFIASNVSSAPFGVEWGEPLSNYGGVEDCKSKRAIDVFTLPLNHSKAASYTLKNLPSFGIQQVTMTTDLFALYSKEGEVLFDSIRQSLVSSGFYQESYQQGTLSSYKCLIQSYCYGDVWSGLDSNGDIVSLRMKSTSKREGFITVEFQSATLIAIKEQERLNELAIAELAKRQDAEVF